MNNFSWPIDGSIVGLYIIVTMAAGIAVRKYVGKVEQFLIAGREMNLYLGIASLAATEFGIVTCMYTAQSGFEKGFAGAVPGLLQATAMFLIGYTGFCVKPLRDAGVMTIPELFQLRYGTGIRWLAGVVIVLGGLLNMGVFLRMGGEFLINATGMNAPAVQAQATPQTEAAQSAPANDETATPSAAAPAPQGFFQTYKLEIMMTALLLAVGIYTVLGGMLSVLVTDFLQFIVMSLGLIAVTVLILYSIGWASLVNTVETHYGAGGFNPFANSSMGWSFIIFNAFVNTAATLTWQTTIQRLLAAKDTDTGRRVYTRTSFFFVCRWLIPVMWGVAALAVFAPTSVDLATHTFVAGGQTHSTLHAMPLFLGTFVPVGLTGILIAAMLAADMSTDSSYMLTWASVIYNDILAPFRKKNWSEKRGLMVSRCLVAGIGVFLLFFGLWYPLKGDLWSYLTVTGTIYLASMSTLLIACCYWKGANNWGAAAAIVLGAIFPISVLVLEQSSNEAISAFAKANGNILGICAYLAAGTAMVFGSLLKNAIAPKGANA
ncbi:MAG: sodium:solute symporter family protein [Candidatus Hydrogenedentes bacterium]|nr:sodium:solute symporter family protein [Candidatus Hydrogenedentota bacterium]